MINYPHLKRSKEWLRKSLEKIQVKRAEKYKVQWWIDNDKLPKKAWGTRKWSKEHPYKVCPTCKHNLHITKFGIRMQRATKKDNLNILANCKICQTARDRDAAAIPRYTGKPKVIVYEGNAEERGRAIKNVLMNYFGRACTRCGYTGQPCQMDFDHIDPESKEFTLGIGGIAHRSVDEIITEVEKCKLICSNCHRVVSSRYETQEKISTHLSEGVNGVLASMSSPEPDKPKLRSDSPVKESIFEDAPAGTRYAADGERPVLVNKIGDKALNSTID